MTSEKLNPFHSILDDLFTVYKNADKDTNILDKSVIPKEFFENNANSIVQSYTEYTKNNEKFETTDIITKYQNREYDSPFQLYHDIKIACASAIQSFKPGTLKYKSIDFLYKFTTELLLRETSRISLILFDESKEQQDKSELESQLSEEFNQISYSYNLSNGEVISHISQTQEVNPYAHSYPNLYQSQTTQPQQNKQPLFTSLVGKSAVDPRQTIVSDPFQISKVVPPNKDIRTNSTLESLLPPSSKIPPPTAQPTQILKDYFHPNWYTIYVPTWLTYKSKISKPTISSSLLKDSNNQDLNLASRTAVYVDTFAPNIDSKRAIVSEELKGNIWLNHLGFKEIQDIKANYTGELPEVPKSQNSLPRVAEDSQIDSMEVEDEKKIASDSDFTEENSSYPKEINVANLVEWDPEKIVEFESIKADEKSIVKSPQELQRLISVNLLKLNRLRQERFLSSNPQNILAPGSTEKRLYNKITKLISLSLELNNLSASDLSLQFSKKIPVLTTEYSGSLPGLPPNKTAPGAKSTRLPSIRGPYKKKNRQL